MSNTRGFLGTQWGAGDGSSTWGLPGRRESSQKNIKCEKVEVERVIREISSDGCFLVCNNLYKLI